MYRCELRSNEVEVRKPVAQLQRVLRRSKSEKDRGNQVEMTTEA